MDVRIVMGVARHLLTALGGSLATAGYVSGEDVDAAIGAILTLVGIAASVWAKRRAAPA